MQIKQTVLYFSGTVGVFSSSIQEIELTNIKIKHYIKNVGNQTVAGPQLVFY